MTTFHQLLLNLCQAKKYPGTKQIDPAPLINEGYPSNFNLSFAYYEWTKKEGQTGPNQQYISFAGDMFYSKYQPCFRYNDWRQVCESENGSRNKHLSYFHMADVSGLMARSDKKYQKTIGEFSIKALLKFIECLGLNTENVYVSFCTGGSVRTLTANKYLFSKNIGMDPFIDTWIECGLPKANLIPDQTRDTLLALRNYARPSPWGYRNEVYYKLHNGELLDIATVEHLCFEPTFDERMNIIDLNQYQHSFSVSAVGVERLLVALNNLNDIRDVNIIKPLYEYICKEHGNISQKDADVIIQTIRPMQAVISDGGKWRALNPRRKEIMRHLYSKLADELAKYQQPVTGPLLQHLLALNAELLQNKVLKLQISSVLMEIRERIDSLSVNKHLDQNKRLSYTRILK